MAHLYRFTCKPNYPVVTDAVLVFYTENKLVNMLEFAIDFAKEQGVADANVDCLIDYVGEINLTGVAEMYRAGIVTCITGEY